MYVRDGKGSTDTLGGGRAPHRRRGPLAAALLVVLMLCCLLAPAASAGAAVKPAKPTAKAPKGTITSAQPTFKWTKAHRAAKYELRVYKGKKLLLKRTGISKRSWKCLEVLPSGVGLSWKVRGMRTHHRGAWSKSLRFTVLPPDSSKALTAFGFTSPPATGVINETLHTVALTVPFGTDRSALVATFATTGASVAVGAAPQVSGVTTNDFTSPRTYTVTAADASTQAYVVTVTVATDPGPGPSSAKAITAFSFQGLTPAVTGAVTEADHTIALTVPFGTDVPALAATFTTTGASVKVGAAPQVSGTTANDFTSPVTYTVTAEDTTNQDYVVTVTVAAAAIGQDYGGGKIAYILQAGDPGYVDDGTTRGLIAAAVDQTGAGASDGIQWASEPYWDSDLPGAKGTAIGTGAANTDAIIAQNGAGATYAAGLARAYTGGGYSDWYLPSKDELNQLYLNRVVIGGFHTASDDWPYYWSSSQHADYVGCTWDQWFDCVMQTNSGSATTDRVRAVRWFPANPAMAITAFSFQGLTPAVTGTVAEADHTIALTVPFGTDVTALVTTFTTTGASVTVGAATQVSGTTANDFTSPVTYTVTAEDTTTQDYVVTVTVTALEIGDAYGGGIVAYILQPADTGYVAGQTHGLIAAAADQPGGGTEDGIQWATEPNWSVSVPGALGTAIGTGAVNTDAIIAQNGAGTTYAAGLARAYTGGGYSDWFLPSKDELNQLYLNRAAIGGFHTNYADEWTWYWSSSQFADIANFALVQVFGVGNQGGANKSPTYRVRAVRSF